jgi:LysM repeat protein
MPLPEPYEHFSELVDSFIKSDFEENLEATKAYLGSLKEIRILIAVSPGLGHQSTSVNIMRRMIHLTGGSSQATPKFTLWLCPTKDGGLSELINKMKRVLPEFDGDLNKDFYVDQRKVSIRDLTKNPPDDWIEFGICGGWDHKLETKGENPPPLEKLKVLNYVQLQPYRWDKGDYFISQRLSQETWKVYHFKDEDEDEDLYLSYRTVYRPDPPAPNWKAINNSPDKERSQIVKMILDSAGDGNVFDVTPLYGISTNAGWDPHVRLYNVMGAILYAQKELQRNKPAVLVNLDEGKSCGEWWECFKVLIKDGKWLEQEQLAAKEKNEGKQKKAFQGWWEENVKDRVTLINALQNPGTVLENLSKNLKDLQSNTVLVINLGGIPPNVFDYLYLKATLPPTLEGQSTVELMLNLGKPYFKLVAWASDWSFHYPPEKLQKGVEKRLESSCGAKAFNLAKKYLTMNPDAWPEVKSVKNNIPPMQLLPLIQAYLKSPKGKDLSDYFHSLRGTYHDEKEDKLLVALNYFVNTVKPVRAEELVLQASAGEPAYSLQDLYTTLMKHVPDRQVNLLSEDVVPKEVFGVFRRFFKGVAQNGSALELRFSEDPTINSDKTVVTVKGTTEAFGVGETGLTVTFSEEDGTFASSCQAVFKGAQLPFPGVPWLGVESTGVELTLREGGTIPVSGAITARFKAGTYSLTMKLPFPFREDRWMLLGDLRSTPSLSELFGMMGGVNFTAMLPEAVCRGLDFHLDDFGLEYDVERSRVSCFTLNAHAGTGEWELTQGISVQNLRFQVVVLDPGDVATRRTIFGVGGMISLWGGEIEVGALLPELLVQGALSRGSSIQIGDVMAFLKADLPKGIAQTTIDSLSFFFDYGAKSYGFDMVLGTQWTVEIGSQLAFEITELGLSVNGVQTGGDGDWGLTGSFTGKLSLFPDDPETKIDLVVSAGYGGPEAGWTFEGKQTGGTISLGELFKTYLVWDIGSDLDIDGLGLKIETQTSSWEFAAKTAKPWFIEPLGLSVSGKVKLGYNGGSNELGVPLLRTGKAEMPMLISDGIPAILLDSADGGKKTGYYGEISADIEWHGIDITVFYNFHPDSKCFEVTWGNLTGKIEEKDVPVNKDNKETEKHQIATLKFTESTTLGSVIETIVSWATGSKFSLSAPWNILDKIPLSNFELVWDFTDETVRFKVNIGPIDLGFAKIESINICYDKDPDEPSRKRVMVDLDASFIWGDKIPKWDATKPETTPSPSGSGNKYLDLRLLALGQHVTVGSLTEADTVQKAIACMADMPDPEPGQIPPVQFDPQSSWLVGADFGILKLEKEKKNGDQSTALAKRRRTPGPLAVVGKDGANYFLTLQVIFNDPYLYALRIALAGEPAKILKGLDFQIMYRQVSETVGVYQSEITLPDVMRHLSIGACSITLPVFAIAIYTNGDFQVDVGFPWNENFSRSFTIEAIIPPGIPVVGSGGLYFGKLSSATSSQVPQATNGTFNPVIVFGFGLQVGFGKSIHYGILSAGFSLTVVGILEGVIAKWNPYPNYQLTGASSDDALVRADDRQVQDAYYFWLRGTVGLMGKLYGTVDFAIIKADVNVEIKLLLQLTYESYSSIAITVIASVSVSVTVKINCGLFKIKIHFSFSLRLKETFTIENHGTAPWHVEAARVRSVLRAPADHRLRATRMRALEAVALAAASKEPDWSYLTKPEEPARLSGYLAPALTMARNEWSGNGQDPKDQVPCYVAMLLIESVPPASEDSASSALKAAGQQDDSPFETLCKMVLRWTIAAIQDKPMSADQVDESVVSCTDLTHLIEDVLVSTDHNPTPIPLEAIDSFLSNQFQLTVQLPPDEDREVHATYFPMAPALKLDIPGYGDAYSGYSYPFADYNSIDHDGLKQLRHYFDELAVQVQREMDRQALAARAEADRTLSMASWITTDYFLLLARQMVQVAREALRDFKYPIQSGQTGNEIVAQINDKGWLEGEDTYTLHDLFLANQTHALTTSKSLEIGGVTYQALASDTFQTVAGRFHIDAADLALQPDNAANDHLLKPGATITYPGQHDYQVELSDSLNRVAEHFSVGLSEFVTNSNIRSLEGLLMPGATLDIPPFGHMTTDGDTLQTVASQYAFPPEKLADQEANGQIANLFATGDADSKPTPYLDVPHLVQFQVKEIIAEVQRSLALQHLSGMASRYYLHGMRLPTQDDDGKPLITPKYAGMWVDEQEMKLPPKAGLYALTGQQFPLPDIQGGQIFTITLDRSAGPDWLLFHKDGQATDQLSIEIAPGSSDAERIKNVKTYAQTHRLDIGLTRLGAEPMYESHLVSYPFASAMLWQSADRMVLPYGTQPEGVQSLRLWKLPGAMVNLPDPARRAINPCFNVQLARYDEATGATVNTPVSYYGWASTIEFTVKKVPAVAASPTTGTTYEIVGAGGNAIVLLERLLDQVGGNDDFFDQLILGYPPDQTGDATEGVQTDPAGQVTMGIAQVNLSTETSPPARVAKALAEEKPPTGLGLLNKQSEFIRLLWEASITRAGGFYLYYYNAAAKGGLPDRVFNDKGEANLTLIAIYAKPPSEDEQNRLTDFMNAVATGESIDTSNSVVFAQADPPDPPTQVPANAEDSLASIAFRYYSNVGDLAAANAGLTLAAGKKVRVTEGLYEVPPDGVEPGGSLSRIAVYFGTTEEAIKEANPRRTEWPDPLPLFTAIRLPKIAVAASPGGTTLGDIAGYYGENLTALAAHNRDVAGLFADGQMVTIPGGPRVRSSTVPQGVVALEASRPVPLEAPDQPIDEEFAREFLLNTYSLLNYQVAGNVDFRASKMGLPAGPTDSKAPENHDKIRIPRTLKSNEDAWDYRQALSYPRFAEISTQATDGELPDSNESPYLGVGCLLQVDFDWQDLYGNTLVTVLSGPQSGDKGPGNQPPLLTGYTDALIGLGQWPSVSAGWQVRPGVAGKPRLKLTLSFDPSHYDEAQTEEWHENAKRHLRFYAQLYYQLTDPNGIVYAIETALLKGPDSQPGALPLSSSQVGDLLDWLFNGSSSIYKFLQDRAAGGTSVPPPQSPHSIDSDLDSDRLNDNQVFELSLSFVIERSGCAILGDLETTPGIKRTATELAPMVQKINSASGNDTNTLGLTQFAKDFQEALSQPGAYLMKVATGVDRSRISTVRDGNTLWAVRLGCKPDDTSQPIAYSIKNKGNPILFAPRPISNKLRSRRQVPIRDYTTGQGLSPTATRQLDFVDIDMDVWGRQFLAAIDGVLAPEFTAAIQIVSEHMRRAKSDPNLDYLKQILEQKKTLAGIVKDWMIPVFRDENPDASNVREAFYQPLLSRLSNAYTTRAAIQFEADVNADVRDPLAQPPRLFGRIVQKESSTGTDDTEPNSVVSLTSPKLELATGPNRPLTFLLTAPDTVKGTGGEVVPSVILNPSFDGSNIEHQIGSVSGIEGYEASSWLSFVIRDPDWPLAKDLGEFKVPMILRAFPACPAMADQTGTATHKDTSTPGELSQLTQWDYSFTYALPFHYPQDRVYCEVDFNINKSPKTLAGFEDAFNQLAQFVTVFPDVNKDLEDNLAAIDATTEPRKPEKGEKGQDDDKICRAAKALEAFINMVSDVTDAAQGAGLVMAERPKPFTSTGVEHFNFYIKESSVHVGSTRAALLVTLVGKPPEGIGRPVILVDPGNYDYELYNGNDCKEKKFNQTDRFCFVYKKKGTNDEYLSAADGQAISDRRVVLPEMDILQRQDAWSTVSIKRNEELVPDKPSAEPFVYTTPEVRFANPCLPTIDTGQEIDIAKIYSSNNQPIKRSLDQQLTALFTALLKDNTQKSATFQVECRYDYSINPELEPVSLSVLMQPPLSVNVKSNEGKADETLTGMISHWTEGITLWFRTHTPKKDEGVLWFDLTIMSNLTDHPMPLLRLRKLKLKLKDMDDAGRH